MVKLLGEAAVMGSSRDNFSCELPDWVAVRLILVSFFSMTV